MLAALATTFVAGKVPVLRHDWPPPEANIFSALDSVAGWNPMGLGSPVGYPSSFMLVPLRALCTALLGSYLAQLLYFACVNALTTFGTARLGRVLGAGPVACVALAACATFNPWAYTQLVAGHLFMLLAYAATLWLVSEILSPSPNERSLCLLVLAIAPQIQFLVIDTVAYGYLLIRFGLVRAAVVLALMWLPVCVGLLATHTSLVGIPFTLQWEVGQSIEPGAAPLLTGYFTRYDSAIAPLAGYASGAFAALAAAGIVIGLARRRFRLTSFSLMLIAVPMLLAMGADGPIAAPFEWAVVHVPETGLFRELYDLLGFLVIGYVCSAAIAAKGFGPIVAPIVAAGLAFPLAWFFGPPARYWVDARDLPKPPPVIAPAASPRYLLLPALNPMSDVTRGGSGIDPDLRPRSGNASPLNEYTVTYPFSSALGWYLENGSTESFAKLGASTIVTRGWLRSDPGVRGQLALPPQPFKLARTATLSVARPTPMLGLSPLPHVGSVDADYGSGNVLFGDARAVRGPGVPDVWRQLPQTFAVVPDNRYVRADAAWVDARLAFVVRPEIATAYGGAFTTDPHAVLPIAGGLDALVWVRGTLLDDAGSTVATTSDGYRWVQIGKRAKTLRCVGECAVAVEAMVPPGIPQEPAANDIEPIAITFVTPFLAFATIGPGPEQTLRLDVAYDALWEAWIASSELPHLRVDGVTNGWLVPAGTGSRRIVIVELGALATAGSEVAALLGVVLTLALAYRLPAISEARAL